MSSSQNLVLSTNLGRIEHGIVFNIIKLRSYYGLYDRERPDYQDMAEIPTFYFSLDDFPRLDIQLDYPSRCSVVVFHGLELGRLKGKIILSRIPTLISEYSEDVDDAVAKLEDILQQIPKFVLVITGESLEEYYASSIKSSASIAWILAGQGGPVISLGRTRSN